MYNLVMSEMLITRDRIQRARDIKALWKQRTPAPQHAGPQNRIGRIFHRTR